MVGALKLNREVTKWPREFLTGATAKIDFNQSNMDALPAAAADAGEVSKQSPIASVSVC